jgi:hypothetical protein
MVVAEVVVRLRFFGGGSRRLRWTHMIAPSAGLGLFDLRNKLKVVQLGKAVECRRKRPQGIALHVYMLAAFITF